MRLIDADELSKDDEVTKWLSKDAIRTGRQLKMFSELFLKKISNAQTVEAIPKDQYEARLKADMVAMLKEVSSDISSLPIFGDDIDMFIRRDYALKTIQKRIDALNTKQSDYETACEGLKMLTEALWNNQKEKKNGNND